MLTWLRGRALIIGGQCAEQLKLSLAGKDFLIPLHVNSTDAETAGAAVTISSAGQARYGSLRPGELPAPLRVSRRPPLGTLDKCAITQP